MATLDRYSEMEHSGVRPERTTALGILSEAITWFAAATAGMLIVFIGLAIDAWRHNNGAGEESLLSIGNPGHLVAGIGLAVTSLSVLAGLSVASLKHVKSADHVIRRMVPVTAAWVILATVAFSSITYIGASGVTVASMTDRKSVV